MSIVVSWTFPIPLSLSPPSYFLSRFRYYPRLSRSRSRSRLRRSYVSFRSCCRHRERCSLRFRCRYFLLSRPISQKKKVNVWRRSDRLSTSSTMIRDPVIFSIYFECRSFTSILRNPLIRFSASSIQRQLWGNVDKTQHDKYVHNTVFLCIFVRQTMSWRNHLLVCFDMNQSGHKYDTRQMHGNTTFQYSHLHVNIIISLQKNKIID